MLKRFYNLESLTRCLRIENTSYFEVGGGLGKTFYKKKKKRTDNCTPLECVSIPKHLGSEEDEEGHNL